MLLQQTTVEGWIKRGSKKSRRVFIIPFIHKRDVEAKNKRVQKINPEKPSLDHGVERVTNAAVRLPNGSVFSGLFHADAVETALAAHANKPGFYVQRLMAKAKDGFLTSKGRFVGPAHAFNIAKKGGQITAKSYARSVEALWGIKPKLGTLNAIAFNDCRTA